MENSLIQTIKLENEDKIQTKVKVGEEVNMLDGDIAIPSHQSYHLERNFETFDYYVNDSPYQIIYKHLNG